MFRWMGSGWFICPAFLVVLALIMFGLSELVHSEATDSKFELIGRVEGCNVYHQPGPYGGSAFAVCH